MDKITAIIVAGGSGKRMGMGIKKQYIKIQGKEVLTHTLEAFEACSIVDEIILVTAKEDITYIEENIIKANKLNKVRKIAEGGAERQDSVYNGLLAADKNTSYVMIHDGARPFITQEAIIRCLQKAKETGASIVGVPVKDTIKICDTESHQVQDTPNRDQLWIIQTPQIFAYDLLMEAYQYAKKNNLQVTDDSMIVEAYGKKVYITEGEYTNIKVTTPEDLIIGEAILKNKAEKNVEKGVDI